MPVLDSQEQQKGTGLGLQLNVGLDLSGIRTLTDTLNDALKETGATATDTVAKVVGVIRQLGVDQLLQWAEKGGAEAAKGFEQLFTKLKEASQKGEQEAKGLVSEIEQKRSEQQHA